MFEYSEKDNAYIAVIDSVKFCCEKIENGYEDIMMQLVNLYKEKLPDIIDFMMDDLQRTFGTVTVEEVINALGMPMIDLDRNIISYLEHTLDDIHIIDVEFSGQFEEFYETIIDG